MLSSINTNIGCIHIHLDSVDSTNIYAKNLIAKSNPIEGTVISADFQTDGKGQFDRKWVSNPSENLMMSIILTPDFLEISRQAVLNMAISLGMLDYLSSNNIPDLALKWPNDLYHQDQKLGGILIQNHVQGAIIKYCIVGIGLNINQIDFPLDLTRSPTSLAHILNKSFDVKDEMKTCWHYINYQYDRLRNSASHISIMRDYNKLIYGKGRQSSIRHLTTDTSFDATIGEVDLLGRLNVVDADGGTHVVEHGSWEIVYK